MRMPVSPGRYCIATDMNQPRPRPHRLPADRYVGKVCVSFTSCTAERRPALLDEELQAALRDRLAIAAENHGCTVPVFVFMPEHMHVLILGKYDHSNVKLAMDEFKLLSGGWLFRNRPGVRWQKGYWDHVVRPCEGWHRQAMYIAANPCRAGFSEDVFSWSGTGSIGYDLREVLSDAFW